MAPLPRYISKGQWGLTPSPWIIDFYDFQGGFLGLRVHLAPLKERNNLSPPHGQILEYAPGLIYWWLIDWLLTA